MRAGYTVRRKLFLVAGFMAGVLLLLLIGGVNQGRNAVQAQPLMADAIIYVRAGAAGANDGTSWEDAYISLQSALEDAVSGDEIWVAAGVYTPTVRTTPADARTATFMLKQGVALYGGFAGIETVREQRDWRANLSILSGDLDHNDAADWRGIVTDTIAIAGDNAYHVVSADVVTATLDGFVITAGKATGADPHHLGGGLYTNGGHTTVTHVGFWGNQALEAGGGFFDRQGQVTLAQLVFAGNLANRGGGMYFYHDTGIIVNSLFAKNRSEISGGALWDEAANSTVRNCTFADNEAGTQAGAILSWGGGNAVTLQNSIVWANTAPNEPQLSGGFVVSYSLVEDGWLGTGNLNADPLFVSPESGDYHLQMGSSALDAGDNGYAPEFDLDGTVRPLDSNHDGIATADMGAYEFELQAVFLPLMLKQVTPSGK